MKLKNFKLSELVPYENNPRINDAVIPELIKSIEQCGYVAPIIVDENGVILAGHTRHKALLEMGRDSAECIVAEGLTEEQKKKFRILDNKTSELAEWDIDLLKGELENLDLGDVHWFDDLINPNLIPVPEETKKTESVGVQETQICCPRCGAVVWSQDLAWSSENNDDEMPY